VSEEGLISLVEYIKNLSSNYRVQQTMNTSDLLPETPPGTAGKATGAAAKPAAAEGVAKP
jgi:cytochrome c oxidase subunit 2